MSFWNNIFGKKKEETRVGGMEDFMTLIRVYFQASMAADLGITSLAALPDLRVFKSTLKVATVNNKLGVGERSRCKNMLKQMYGMDDEFFKEIDTSLRKRCKKVQDAQTYLFQFQGFTQELMMLTGNLMKFKLRLPGSDAGVMKSVVAVRQYAQRLGFSQQWITNFVYKVVMLAKKEPKPKE